MASNDGFFGVLVLGVCMANESTKEKIQKVLTLMAEGQSLRKSCADAEIPKTVFLENVESDQYARARDAQADAHFDGLIELEEQCRDGVLDPQAFRALLDSRKWRLARMRPKLYGDRATVDHTSSDGSFAQKWTPAEVAEELIRQIKSFGEEEERSES